MRGFKTTLAGTAMTALGLVLAANTASAGWLPGFSGYSVFGASAVPCPLCDSTVTFGVWEAEGNDGWQNDAPFAGRAATALNGTNGIGGGTTFPAGTDFTARYVYAYQVFNSDPLNVQNPPLQDFNIAVEYKNTTWPTPLLNTATNPFTSGGYFNNTTFNAPINQVVPDNLPFDWTPDALREVAIENVTVANPDPDAINFNLIANAGVAGGAAFPGNQFVWNDAGDGLIPALGNTDVLFLTSNIAPSIVWAETQSIGGFGSAGDIAGIKVPEPISLALFGFALAGLGVARRRKA